MSACWPNFNFLVHLIWEIWRVPKNRGPERPLGVTLGDRKWHRWIPMAGLLIVFCSNYRPKMHRLATIHCRYTQTDRQTTSHGFCQSAHQHYVVVSDVFENGYKKRHSILSQCLNQHVNGCTQAILEEAALLATVLSTICSITPSIIPATPVGLQWTWMNFSRSFQDLFIFDVVWCRMIQQQQWLTLNKITQYFFPINKGILALRCIAAKFMWETHKMSKHLRDWR